MAKEKKVKVYSSVKRCSVPVCGEDVHFEDGEASVTEKQRAELIGLSSPGVGFADESYPRESTPDAPAPPEGEGEGEGKPDEDEGEGEESTPDKLLDKALDEEKDGGGEPEKPTEPPKSDGKGKGKGKGKSSGKAKGKSGSKKKS